MKAIIALGNALVLAMPLMARAHVVVTPGQAGVGRFQTFTIGVPVEKPVPTIGVRIVIPEGVEAVLPNVKAGWKITVKRSDAAQEQTEAGKAAARVTEIEWSEGIIPAGQRDDFLFSAKVPPAEILLRWKAYQTYGDGSVVSWDRDANDQPKNDKGAPDFSKSGPYSQTRIVDDLKRAPQNSGASDVPLWLSVVAVILSLGALLLSWKRVK
jgi:uncharacterized protein YcnI